MVPLFLPNGSTEGGQKTTSRLYTSKSSLIRTTKDANKAQYACFSLTGTMPSNPRLDPTLSLSPRPYLTRLDREYLLH